MERRLLRIEGEGEVVVEVNNGVVRGVRFKVLEAPRFFTHVVKGLHYSQVPDLVSRICGFCGVSYVIASSRAFERCLGVKVPKEVEDLRVSLHLAERVKSHLLHTLFMALPDLTGAKNIASLVARNPAIVGSGLKVLQWARTAMEILGGRFHNVVTVKPGGFYHIPHEDKVRQLAVSLVREVLPHAYEFAKFVLSLKTVPEENHRYNLLVVKDERDEYPHLGVEVLFNGSTYSAADFYEKVVEVEVVEDSTSLQYRVRGEAYLVGPLARYNTSFGKLAGEAQDLARNYSWTPPLENVYQQVVARVVETIDALTRLKEYFEAYRYAGGPCVEQPRGVNDTCAFAVEAPRGVLYHYYELDEDMKVKRAKIITPTAQSLATAQKLAEVLTNRLYSPAIIEEANRLITAFDPCLSCAVNVKFVK